MFGFMINCKRVSLIAGVAFWFANRGSQTLSQHYEAIFYHRNFTTILVIIRVLHALTQTSIQALRTHILKLDTAAQFTVIDRKHEQQIINSHEGDSTQVSP